MLKLKLKNESKTLLLGSAIGETIKNLNSRNFEVHLKVKLIEDDDDGAIFVNANIVGEFGYAQPLETPIASESSTHQFCSPVAGVDYVFQERTAPTISMVETWTAVNYLTVTITGV